MLLKIQMCLSLFAASKIIREVKLYRRNLNISKYFIKYLTKFHTGAETENASKISQINVKTNKSFKAFFPTSFLP